jgi:hypothetical protein
MLQAWLRTRPHGARRPPTRHERRLGEALRGHATQRGEQEERAMAWEDPSCSRELEPPAQGWWDWQLRDEER